MKNLFLLVAAVTFSSAELASAAWPRLGELGVLSADAAERAPEELDPEKNAAWVVDLPGPGASTPLVAGERIFVTCEIDGANGVVCLGRDGSERWRRTVGDVVEAKHKSATGANPSPAANDQHVVVYYKDTTLACFTVDGEPVWRTNLTERYGEGDLWWDLATSPVITSHGVVVAVIHEGESYLVTFDLASGDPVWRQLRNYECETESDQAYTTPAVIELGGVETIVTLGADHLTGHDAATGELLWESDTLNPDNLGMWRNIASAAIDAEHGIAVVPFGRSEYLGGLRLGARAKPQMIWTVEGLGSDVPTPQIVGDHVYVLDDRDTSKDTVTCLALETGEQLWQQKTPRGRGKFFSSPLVVGDRMYCVRNNGEAYVFRLTGDGIELLSKSKLGEQVVATPVVIDSDVLVRTRGRLYRFTGE